jgi:hypothetical protein
VERRERPCGWRSEREWKAGVRREERIVRKEVLGKRGPEKGEWVFGEWSLERETAKWSGGLWRSVFGERETPKMREGLWRVVFGERLENSAWCDEPVAGLVPKRTEREQKHKPAQSHSCDTLSVEEYKSQVQHAGKHTREGKSQWYRVRNTEVRHGSPRRAQTPNKSKSS